MVNFLDGILFLARITQKEKIKVYEQLLHDLYFASQVTMNNERVGKLLMNIGRWSYSHRCGNGELSERTQNSLINESFRKLLDVKEK